MKKVLLFGAAGQLGNLVAQTVPKGINLQKHTRESLDITDSDAVDKIIQHSSPDLIINTAAYTAVDNAEARSEKAYQINSDGVMNIAQSAADSTKIIHISTDFVFSKQSNRPYLPDDDVLPVSVYGKSKRAGEKALLSYHQKNAVIIRTSWLYSANCKNFVTTMLELMRTRNELNVVNDQFGSPTSAVTLADIIWKFSTIESSEGIFHWSDRGITTWYDFAVEIQKQALSLGLLEKGLNINPIPTEKFPTPAERPKFSALDSSKSEALLGTGTIPWQDQLNLVLKKMKGQC